VAPVAIACARGILHALLSVFNVRGDGRRKRDACLREMRDVRLSIGSNAASVWWVNGKEVIGIYGVCGLAFFRSSESDSK